MIDTMLILINRHVFIRKIIHEKKIKYGESLVLPFVFVAKEESRHPERLMIKLGLSPLHKAEDSLIQ